MLIEFSEHIKTNWINHVAAASGSIFSLLNGAAILQSIIVGVSIYVITHFLNKIFTPVTNKITIVWNKFRNK